MLTVINQLFSENNQQLTSMAKGFLSKLMDRFEKMKHSLPMDLRAANPCKLSFVLIYEVYKTIANSTSVSMHIVQIDKALVSNRYLNISIIHVN